jgi:ion channel
MLNSPLCLGATYFAVALFFSLIYYVAWRLNTDAFIVHQEMNLRPLALWRKLSVRLHGTSTPPASVTGEKPLEEIFQEYSELSANESRLATELESIAPQLERAGSEVKRLGALHNAELAANMTALLERQKQQHRNALEQMLNTLSGRLATDRNAIQEASATADRAMADAAAAHDFSIDSLLSQSTKTTHLADLDKAISAETSLRTRQLQVTDEIRTLRGTLRSLLETWEKQRLSRLSYFDFLYFSMGVATSNTFGDLIPNERVVRFVIITQLVLSLTLVGRFVNSVK